MKLPFTMSLLSFAEALEIIRKNFFNDPVVCFGLILIGRSLC